MENGLLKALPFARRNDLQLSAKDKRYSQLVEKALLTFESLDEWADYIAFLSRLQKALLLSEDTKLAHNTNWIPHSSQVANKLSLCLSSRLPNGVHQKTLSIYESIFTSLSIDTFNNDVAVWLPGLLPVLSYGSIQVRSAFVRIFNVHIIPNINQTKLKIVTKPLILCFLAGLDDENSESFTEVFDMIDKIKSKLNDDRHFWQCFFLAIISNPERRLGGLYWCNKRLPVFTAFKSSTEESKYSDEALACLVPTPGLLVRAFAAAINTVTTFNSANDIIIIRGFFDLLLSHLPLSSDVLQSHPLEKQLLLQTCCQVTLKKDMSLNRRLWNWLLGPDSDHLPENPSVRSQYFESYGLDSLSSVLLTSIQNDSASITSKIDTFKVCLSLIIDKWEISHLLIPKLLSPILKCCYQMSKLDDDKFPDLLSSAQAFFNGVEAFYIWSDIVGCLNTENTKDTEDTKDTETENNTESLKTVEFILTHFDVSDEEMKLNHVPLSLIVSLLNSHSIDATWLHITSILLQLISPKSLHPIDYSNETTEKSKSDPFSDPLTTISHYYKSLIHDETTPFPFSKLQVSELIYNNLKRLMLSNMANSTVSYKLCDLYKTLIYLLPSPDSNEVQKLRDPDVINTICNLPENTSNNQSIMISAFSISQLFKLFSSSMSASEKNLIVKIITRNLWPAIISPDPTQYQVEAVKCVLDLDINCPDFQIEASISYLILQSTNYNRVKALSALWDHSNSHESDLILARPLQLVLDDLFESQNPNRLAVVNFISNVLKSGSTNRLLKMITNPLLDFEFMESERTELEIGDELGQFAYHLATILNVLQTNIKTFKESANNEFAVMDNSSKIKTIKDNQWDISTYKSLIFYIIEKFLALKLHPDMLLEESLLKDYYNCVENCLELYTVLVNGYETEFNDRFHMLIECCSRYIFLENECPYYIELTISRYLKCILNMLKVSEESMINLNLLHLEDQEREPILVRFIVNGIEKTQTVVLLEQWISLMTRSLYLFNESVFSVLTYLNTSLISKIETYFEKVVIHNNFRELTDIEKSISALISGLEDLLSISHSYLLTSKLRHAPDNNGNSGDSGFFGNVIQGVFQIESPTIRTSEQNKLYAILLAFHDAIRVGFNIWDWCDKKPKPKDTSIIMADKSMSFLANKLKFRAKKLLESLMDLEKQEVIEKLIELDTRDGSTLIKLLNVLDGGRSQITLPHILNSILARSYPLLVEDSKKSYLDVAISDKELTRFLVEYFQSIDNDTISDVWQFTLQFFRGVLAHANSFKSLIPDLLRVISSLSVKLNHSKFNKDKRHRKELSDIFMKLLTSVVSAKRILFSSNDIVSTSEPEKEMNEKQLQLQGNQESSEDTSSEVESINEAPQGIQKEMLSTAVDLIPGLDEILQDSDKVSSCINILVFNLITPQIKGKKVADFPIIVLTLLKVIGQFHPNRSWKSFISDVFMDNGFFTIQGAKLDIWKHIISCWISVDSDRFGDIISKISTLSLTSPGNIFSWNEKSEVENKLYSIKRLSFLLLIQPVDYFLANFEPLFDKIEESFMISTCPISYKTQITILFRVITLKFSEMHLLPHWSYIFNQLNSIFEATVEKSMRELSFLSEDELQLILHGCKLLDQLLLISNDEFNLNEWLFIENTNDVTSTSTDHSTVALIDKIVTKNDLTILKDLPVKLQHSISETSLIPLLTGVNSIKSIANLRTFFESLSYLHYERVYSLSKVDLGVCEADVYSDLFL